MTTVLSATIFWIAACCFVIAEIAIIRSAIVGRLVVPANAGTMPPVRRAAEIVWALIPALALAVLMLFTWRAIAVADSARSGAAMHGESRHGDHGP